MYQVLFLLSHHLSFRFPLLTFSPVKQPFNYPLLYFPLLSVDGGMFPLQALRCGALWSGIRFRLCRWFGEK